MKIINQHQIPFDPTTELAGLVLIREALTQNLLETGPIQEPLLLIAKLEANPRLAMSLMTESEPGVEFEMELSENLPEAAAQILEEIVASLRATVPPMLL
jgi:Ni,Fe-hydrogenase maturation factor